MLQENEEVHQMSSDDNQKTETRYVCCSTVPLLWEGSCTALVWAASIIFNEISIRKGVDFVVVRGFLGVCVPVALTTFREEKVDCLRCHGPSSSCIDRTFEEACPVPGLFSVLKANIRFSMCQSNHFHRQWFNSENLRERKNYVLWKPCFSLGWNYSACAGLALASYPGIIELDCFDKAL